MTPVLIPAGACTVTAELVVGEEADLASIEQLTFPGRGNLSDNVQVISDAVLPIEH